MFYCEFCKISKNTIFTEHLRTTASVEIMQKRSYHILKLIKSLNFRSNRPEVLLGKGVLKICSKFTGEHPCRSVISIKLLCNFIEITLWHGYSPVNLLHFFRAPFSKNTSGWLLLVIQVTITLGVILCYQVIYSKL